MAGAGWLEGAPLVNPTATQTKAARANLERALQDEGSGFEFFQAMRLLMRLYPERVAVGGWDDPAREVVRISVPPSLAFPPSEIAELRLPLPPTRPAETSSSATSAVDDRTTLSDTSSRDSNGAPNGTPAQMSVRFFGLTGPQGVLPHVYTEHASTRARAKDTAFRDFLDLFHHRILSLLYRAWERHRTTVAAERGDEDRMRSHLLDFAGVGTAGVQQRSDIPVDSVAYYAGLLALRTRPAVGLAQIIGDYFRVKATVEQFVGEWQPLRGGGQLNVGADDQDGLLGMGVLGNAVFDPLSRVRVRIGPLTRVQFNAFLPGGKSHDSLCRLARFYADDQAGVEAQLVLAKEEVPAAALGVADAPDLGFGTWLRSKPPSRDVDDVRLTLC